MPPYIDDDEVLGSGSHFKVADGQTVVCAFPLPVSDIETQYGKGHVTSILLRDGKEIGIAPMMVSTSLKIAISAAKNRGIDVKAEWVKLTRTGAGSKTRYDIEKTGKKVTAAQIPEDEAPF